MRKTTLFILTLLAALAALCGYLLSKASLVGRAGITLMYKEYKFLKVWWQGAGVVFLCWMLFLVLQAWVNRKAKGRNATLAHIGAFILAAAGLFFTYQDFRNNLSHRLLGERFHVGAYLFWIGWMVISLYYLFKGREARKSA